MMTKNPYAKAGYCDYCGKYSLALKALISSGRVVILCKRCRHE